MNSGPGPPSSPDIPPKGSGWPRWRPGKAGIWSWHYRSTWLGGSSTGPVGPAGVRPPPAVGDARRRPGFAVRTGPRATGLPGDVAAPSGPLPIWRMCSEERKGQPPHASAPKRKPSSSKTRQVRWVCVAMDTTCRVACPAGQVQAPATRSMAKPSLGKCLLSRLPGTRASSFRPASPKSRRLPPSPYAVSPMALPTSATALIPLCSTGPNALVLSQVLPGGKSGAVINRVSVSTTAAALCPSIRCLPLLWPWRISGSCADTIRSLLTPCLRLTTPSESATWSSPSPTRFTSWSSSYPSNSAHPAWSAVERCRLAVPPWVCRANSES